MDVPEVVLDLGVVIIMTVNVALWAFRPNDFGNAPQLHQGYAGGRERSQSHG